jgi:hypothetical protein
LGVVGFLGVAVALTGCSGADVEGATDATESVASTSEALSNVANASWFADSLLEGVPVHRKNTNTLDQLVIHSSGAPGRWNRDSSGAWAFEFITGAPTGVTARAINGAYSGGVGALDVFIRGSDNKIYWTFRETEVPGSAWAGWTLISGATTVKSVSTVAVANRGVGNMDVFWITNVNTIAHVKITNFVNAAPVAGSSTRPWFQPAFGSFFEEIRAVAWDANRVDVFARAGGRIHHSFQINGSWGTVASPNRESIVSTLQPVGSTSTEFLPVSFAVSSPAPGIIDLVALAQESSSTPVPPLKMAKVQFNSGWPVLPGPGNWIRWTQMSVNPSSTALPPKFFGATTFNDFGTSKVNLLGGGRSDLDGFDAYISN